METKTNPNHRKHASNFINGILWSGKSLSANFTNTMIVTYLAFYATDVLGMGAALISTVLLITKLFDGVTDLIAGYIIDNTRTRFGKARPYDWCIPFVALFTILLFSAPQASQGVQAVYLAVMYILVQCVFVTLLGASDSVYLLRAFPEEKERNSVFSISQITAQVFSVTMNILIPQLVASAGTSRPGWTRMAVIGTVPFAIISMIRFFTIKEVQVDEPKKASEHKKSEKEKVSLKDGVRAIAANRYLLILTLAIFIIVVASGFLNSSMAYYFQYFVKDQGAMSIVNLGAYATLLMLVIFVPLANKFGKCRVLKLSLATSCVGALIRCIAGANIPLMTLGFALLMFGIMPISIYFPLFLFDIMDYSEWKTGARVEGMLAVFPIFANKVASGISVSIGGFILAGAGYQSGAAEQSAKVMNAINFNTNIAPAILLVAMTLILVFFYDIDKHMPQVKADLAARKAQKEAIAE